MTRFTRHTLAPLPPRRLSWQLLVARRYLFHVINHQEINRGLLRGHLQPELVAHGPNEEGGIHGTRPAFIRRQVHREIEVARKTGLVHDGAPEYAGERLAELRKRE